MARSSFLILILSAALSAPVTATAQVLLAGPEWEFTNATVYRGDRDVPAEIGQGVVGSTPARAARDRMAEAILRRCLECKSKIVHDKYGLPAVKIQFPQLDDWWVTISMDPATIEVQSKPLTLVQFRAIEDQVQEYIFDAARAAQLTARWDLGSAAHIHLGLEQTFHGDRLLFRNFVVAFMNHPELASGIFEDDPANAPSLQSLGEEPIEAFKNLLAEFDRGDMSITTFAQRIVDEVQYKTTFDWGPTAKYQALNFLRVVEPKLAGGKRTLEVRSLRAQRSMHEFVRVLEFFQQWLNSLSRLKAPLPLDIPNRVLSETAREARFKALVKEIGGEWSEFKKLIPKYAGEPVGSNCDRLLTGGTKSRPGAD